jgi:ribonuclease HI
MSQDRNYVVYIDGGARGNPGPAGAGVRIEAGDDGTALFEGGWYLGRATNNVAEYRALVEGLARAAALAAEQVEVRSDSELLVRQMRGEYRVRNARLRELFERANRLCRDLVKVRFTHVRREANADADRLANQAINLERNVEDAESER